MSVSFWGTPDGRLRWPCRKGFVQFPRSTLRLGPRIRSNENALSPGAAAARVADSCTPCLRVSEQLAEADGPDPRSMCSCVTLRCCWCHSKLEAQARCLECPTNGPGIAHYLFLTTSKNTTRKVWGGGVVINAHSVRVCLCVSVRLFMCLRVCVRVSHDGGAFPCVSVLFASHMAGRVNTRLQEGGGCTGLNLVAASRLYLMDLWWNPARASASPDLASARKGKSLLSPWLTQKRACITSMH